MRELSSLLVTIATDTSRLLPRELAGGEVKLKRRFEAFGRDDEFLIRGLLLSAAEAGMWRVAGHALEEGAGERL